MLLVCLEELLTRLMLEHLSQHSRQLLQVMKRIGQFYFDMHCLANSWQVWYTNGALMLASLSVRNLASPSQVRNLNKNQLQKYKIQ